MNQYLFVQDDLNLTKYAEVVDSIRRFSEEKKIQMYVLKSPLTDRKYRYGYDDFFILLSTKHKIVFVSCRDDFDNDFDDYIDDVIEDVGSISDKYLYKDKIGRSRRWRVELTDKILAKDIIEDAETFFANYTFDNKDLIRKLELVISLFIGSINDISNVDIEPPIEILDKVKHKIQLFDGDQTNFIYGAFSNKKITIQGLSGTGKTELLLHKLKELYTEDEKNKIYFTCHNRILAKNLRERIPQFFNFMKIEVQIEWNKRLWCTHAWGNQNDIDSGFYRYICDFYNIPFRSFSTVRSFPVACGEAVELLSKMKAEKKEDWRYAFTYVLVDESQDFDENFFSLCMLAAKKQVYIAGDIFQSIFEDASRHSIKPDFLLSKCYRTDPKTLMFAHALGMGLFEEKKLWWLNKEEWRDCGYEVKEDGNNYILTREPIRRFEDVDDDYDSVKIYSTEQFVNGVVWIIKELKRENPTLGINDVGIILLDDGEYIYTLMNEIAEAVKKEFLWEANIAYMTKAKRKGTLFVSNINNVKGLEFPFVICVTRRILSSSKYRTALYTMLTRSFLRSYLLIQRSGNAEIKDEIMNGYRQIKKEKRMTVSVPKEEEIAGIRARISYEGHTQSQKEVLDEIFMEKQYESEKVQKIKSMIKSGDIKTNSKEELERLIDSITKFL